MDQRELFKHAYLFRDVAAADLHAVMGIAQRKEYLNGDVVYRQEDIADAMFLVEMGTVDIVPGGKEIAIASVGTGQLFGEVAFFDRSKRTGAAQAREVTRVLRIPYDKLDTVLAERPALAISFHHNACAFLAKHLPALALDLNRRYL